MEYVLLALALLGIVALIAVFACLPALLLTLCFNWLAPQFGVHFHLHFLQAWVGLFALGIVGRTLFGARSKDSK